MGQMREAIRQIGAAIRRASVYPPIRNHAAAVASTAPPKNFIAQLRALYDDFVRRWRYVKDPVSRELITASPQAIWRLTMAGDGVGVGAGKGAGDCDCASVALGAELEAVGFPVRLGTTARRGARPGRLFHHVFVQAHVPRYGWITLDPVLHPARQFGALTDHARIAWWDLNGNLIGHAGNVAGHLSGEDREDTMAVPNIDQWNHYGFAGTDIDHTQGEYEPEDWSTVGLAGWGYMAGPGGTMMSAVDRYGIIDGVGLSGIGVEVDSEDEWEDGSGLVRTPMLELAPEDFQYMRDNGRPYHGMMALGDTGEIYTYDGLGGFFKKLFKKIKRGVKKVARKVKRGIKKVLSKTKFGRWLIKVGGKIKKIAMKIVRPLVKFVGKWAGKLAPIAAIIPGYGTAIAAALTAAGRIAKVMQKYGVRTKGKKGTVRSLKFKNPKRFPKFKKALTGEAKRMQRLKRSNPARYRAYLAKAKAMGRR